MTAFLFHALTTIAYALHIGGGAVGLVSGTVAAFARKGGRLHRTAGTVFVASMAVMAVFAFYLAVVTSDQVNLFISVFAFYLVATAWLTVWRKEGTSGLLEKIALVVAVILLAPFAILVFQLAVGAPPLFKSTVAFEGPVLIALYGFTLVLAIAAVSDAKVVLAGGIAGAPRIARHLWRMCVGLMLAAGSAFTNGLPRLLPGPVHVPPEFFFPQFVPLGLLVFWMIRVRATGWYRRNSVAAATSGVPQPF
jgi:uncharacterized membrane protein